MHKVFAAVDIKSTFEPAKKFADVGTLVTVIVKNAMVLAGLALFLILIIGGFSVVAGAGSGDPHKVEQGQKAIMGAVIGIVLIATSVLIMQVIAYITGIDLLKNLFK